MALLLDMSTLKAANADAVFEDLIWWHLTGDWEEDNDLEGMLDLDTKKSKDSWSITLLHLQNTILILNPDWEIVRVLNQWMKRLSDGTEQIFVMSIDRVDGLKEDLA
ncbi:hypothetical protein JHK87_015905 [Glycine soja]|nr:hypothetical protein JHK87_015905 [Glycine soja]